MGILNIAPATRAGAHLLIGLFGPPESGKTYSALMLAAGMVPDPKRRILLDTESGRGRLYASDIPGGYDYAELTRPFTPERYVEALLEIEAAGYEVVVVDSVSHVWQGEGGVLDQADKNGKEGLQKWLKPKLAYRKLTNRLLASRMHMILCSRAKQPMVEGVDGNGKKTLKPGPWIEVQDKSLRYELTAVLEMTQRGAFTVRKCPGALDTVFGTGGTVGTEMGQRVADWVAGGDARDPAFDALRSRADDAAEEGTEAFRAWWKTLDDLQRRRLKPFAGNYESVAKAADAEAERERAARREAGADLEDPFGDRRRAAAPPHDPATGEVHESPASSRHPDDAPSTGTAAATPETKTAAPPPSDDQPGDAELDPKLVEEWKRWGTSRTTAIATVKTAAALDKIEKDIRPHLADYMQYVGAEKALALEDLIKARRGDLAG